MQKIDTPVTWEQLKQQFHIVTFPTDFNSTNFVKKSEDTHNSRGQKHTTHWYSYKTLWYGFECEFQYHFCPACMETLQRSATLTNEQQADCVVVKK